MREILSEDGETREFLVLLPKGEFYDSRQREIEEALRREFPNMKFTLRIDDDERVERGFGVMPILGVADTGKPMLEWPSNDVLTEVCLFIGGYVVQKHKSEAAIH